MDLQQIFHQHCQNQKLWNTISGHKGKTTDHLEFQNKRTLFKDKMKQGNILAKIEGIYFRQIFTVKYY